MSAAGAADAVRTLLRGLGQVLITLGVVLLLFCVYEVKVTNLVTDREQSRLHDEIEHAWRQPPASQAPGLRPVAVELGAAFAIIHIPRLDADASHRYARVVVEGTSHEDLKKGPGHLLGSGLAGQPGNLVISGHRTTYGAPFADIDRLRPGDAVVVETRDTWYTYRVTGTTIVAPTDVAVTLPVPRQPGIAPTSSVLTLTTCHPKYSAQQRMVVSGVLDATLPRSQGDPPALSGG